MAKKKNKSSSAKKSSPAKSTSAKNAAVNKVMWAVLGTLAVLVVVMVVSNGSGSDTQGQTGSAPSQSGPSQQDYIGRLLPAGYAGPQVAERTLYTSTVQMTVVPATQDAGTISVPVAEVVSSKIVRFDYERADGEVLPMIAYVKPSGSLFVGVSYCPPCEGEGQRIESDGTLTCESCGTKRNLETNEGISGACALYPLDEVPASVAGDKIVVDGSVLDSWTPQPLDRPVG